MELRILLVVTMISLVNCNAVSECSSSQISDMKFSVSSYRNQTGHWVAQVIFIVSFAFVVAVGFVALGFGFILISTQDHTYYFLLEDKDNGLKNVVWSENFYVNCYWFEVIYKPI